jgi:hypothetical protein
LVGGWINVRLNPHPESGHSLHRSECPLWAMKDILHRRKQRTLALAMDLGQTTEVEALPGWRRHPKH